MKTETLTPRTDAAAKADCSSHFPSGNHFLKHESVQLETELAQLRAQLEGMVNGQKQDQQHIERLERERDEWRALCARLTNISDYEQLKGHK